MKYVCVGVLTLGKSGERLNTTKKTTEKLQELMFWWNKTVFVYMSSLSEPHNLFAVMFPTNFSSI